MEAGGLTVAIHSCAVLGGQGVEGVEIQAPEDFGYLGAHLAVPWSRSRRCGDPGAAFKPAEGGFRFRLGKALRRCRDEVAALTSTSSAREGALWLRCLGARSAQRIHCRTVVRMPEGRTVTASPAHRAALRMRPCSRGSPRGFRAGLQNSWTGSGRGLRSCRRVHPFQQLMSVGRRTSPGVAPLHHHAALEGGQGMYSDAGSPACGPGAPLQPGCPGRRPRRNPPGPSCLMATPPGEALRWARACAGGSGQHALRRR